MVVLNLDATIPFLEAKSVNLFIVNPPYWKSDINLYGSSESQINNTESYDDYLYNLELMLKNMENGLRDDGHIFIILPFDEMIFETAEYLGLKNNLFTGKPIIWDYTAGMKDGISVILHFYNKQYKEVSKRIFEYPVVDISDLINYKDVGYIYNTLPKEIYDILISEFSNEGDVVADICGGTGNIAISALDLNRDFIYNDLSIEQYTIARDRIERHICYTKTK